MVGLLVEKAGIVFVAIFHTLTRSFLLITVELWEFLQQDPSRIVDQAVLQLLYEQGFLVELGTDETAVYEAWKQRWLHEYMRNVVKSKVSICRTCNLACTYCLLKPAPVVMSSEEARIMDRYYLNEIDKKRPVRVFDEYSGGELTLNIDVVLESASRRFHYCKDRTEYGFSIVTNMTLMTPSIIKRLKEVGLTRVRASLAGPQPVNDRLRMFPGGGPTYEIVMRNMDLISRMIPIRIECQYDAGSKDYLALPEMMDDFSKRGIEVETFNFAPIMPRRGGTCFHAGVGDPHIGLYLAREAARRGYPAFSDPPSSTCGVDLPNHYYFDADNADNADNADTSIVACAALDHGEMKIGDCTRGIDLVCESQLLKRKSLDKCRTCDLGGLCLNGGCRLKALTDGNGFDGVDCQYETIKLFLHEYMRRKAEEAFDSVETNVVPNT